MSLLTNALEGFSGQLPSLPLPMREAVTVVIASEPYEVDERDINNPTETTGNKVLVVDVATNDGETYTVYLQAGMLTALARANRLAGLPIDTLELGATYTLTKTGIGTARNGRNAPNLYTWKYMNGTL